MKEIELKAKTDIKIQKVDNNEGIFLVSKLAREIWPEVYKDILEKDHIDFLLKKYFVSEAIIENINKGYEYYLLSSEQKLFGFFSFVNEKSFIYIDKLYFLNDFRRKGIAKEIIDFIHKFYKKPLKLNVNQQNLNAIKAYLAIGFEIEKEEIINLNNGLVNKDFVMVYKNL